MTSEQVNMIEDNTTWYLGTVGADTPYYKLAKYTDPSESILTSNTTTAKVGLLRYGELMQQQFNFNMYIDNYFLLTPYIDSTDSVSVISGNHSYGVTMYNLSVSLCVRPSMNLKSNVVITGGTGTKTDPFTIELSN